MKRGKRAALLARLDLAPGQPVLVHLAGPKEKTWGVLLSASPIGVSVRGIDLGGFDDWLLQEAHGAERQIGLLTLFYPWHRVERVERDETVGPVEGYADRLLRATGRSLLEVLGSSRPGAPVATRP